MNTRLTILAAVALALSITAASAADMRGPASVPAAVPHPAPVYNWAGLYFGGSIGGGWGSSDWVTNATLPGERVNTDPDGWIGGGQVGFRFEIAPSWLIGVEVSGAYADLDETRTSVFAGRTRRTQLRSLFAVTGQIGHSWGPWLVYAKGGWAMGDVRREANNNNPGGFDVAWTQSPDGWTAGAGFEYMIHPNISLGAEYAYYSLSLSTINRPNSGGIVVTAGSSDFDIHTVMARINFRFGMFP
jgi:outer membrane immunogenic protein